jgi:hypothetical protein
MCLDRQVVFAKIHSDPIFLNTLGVLLKYQDDIARIQGGKAKELLDEVARSSGRRRSEQTCDQNHLTSVFSCLRC